MNDHSLSAGAGKPSADAFSRGDYASAALFGAADDWRTFAAQGLIGLAEPALRGLSGFSNTEARFYEAVTRWIDGQDAAAARQLAGIDLEHARNLLRLVQRPTIRVLSQCDRGSQWDFITSIRKDPRFEIVNYGFDVNDQPIKPYTDIRRCFDASHPPDFYIAKMLEWHLLPPNLQSLPCPIFGHTADYDLHIQAVQPWLQVFDEVLTTDHTEYSDVARLRTGPVSVFPKAFGLALKLPPVPEGHRAMDVFISGTTRHPYHPDKAQLIHQVLRNRGLKLKFLEGFLAMPDYLNILGCTRGAFTYIRHAGGMPTRGMEALAMGAAIAVQKESILRAYLGEEDGVLPYSIEARDLPDVLERISLEWSDFRERALRGAAKVRREFTSERAASQYFRFLTFLAAKPRGSRAEVPPQALRQKRSILCKGWSWRPAVNLSVRQQSLKAWSLDLVDSPSPQLIINMARELVLEFATVAYFPAAQTYQKNFNVRIPYDRSVLTQALELYRIGAKRYPRSLVLRFNGIRAALHFGEPEEVTEALCLATQILSEREDFWQVKPDEDVFPWDFFGQFFNYRAYFDRCTLAFQDGLEAGPDLRRLILASLAYYVACYPEWGAPAGADPASAPPTPTLQRRLAWAERGVDWDGEFPFYRFLMARLLLEKREPVSDGRAADLLVYLASETMLHQPAAQLLLKLSNSGRCHHPQLKQVLEQARLTDERLQQTLLGREDWEALPLRAPWREEAKSAPPSASPSPERQPKILYLCLEFAQWQYAKRLAYPAGLGLEEGFRANHVDCLTFPSVCGFSESARKAWELEVRRLCQGKNFDQVWVELVHSEWTDEFWQWVSTLAPVRVGLVMESLRYSPEVYAQAPQLQERRDRVVQRLSHVTHALCIDEADAEELNRQRTVSALWWPQTVPGRFIHSIPGANPDRRALFSGAVYGNRSELLQQASLLPLLSFQIHPGEQASRYPVWFDELFRSFDSLLSSGQSLEPEWLALQLEAWRRIRTASFGLWLRGLQEAGPVVNLPSFVNSFAGRVFEAMAAGRPVVSWEMVERPRTLELFRRDEEIRFFAKDDAASLVQELRELEMDPDRGRRQAEQAQLIVKRDHTVEQRVAQILAWIREGTVPDYAGPKEPAPVAEAPDYPRSAVPRRGSIRRWLALLAEVRFAQGDSTGAFECLDAVLEEAPRDVAIQLLNARLSLEAEDVPRALRALDDSFGLDATDRTALRLLSRTCRHLGQAGLTLRMARLLSRVATEDLEVQVELATAGIQPSDPSAVAASRTEYHSRLEALVCRVEEAFQQKPAQGTARPVSQTATLGNLARAVEAFERGDWARAWQLSWEAVRVRPFHPEAWLLQARIAAAAGDEQAGKECLARIKQRVPKWKAARNLAGGLVRDGKSAEAPPIRLAKPDWLADWEKQPRLTVCLIAKNEERFLSACLKSIQGVADQIVLVDTGSTDRTLEIAQTAGAEIHHFDWCDDFSAARNAALEHARGDWVLVLDADEELLPESQEKLKQALRQSSVLAWRLPLTDVGKEKEGCHYIPRLFRNIPGACFAGRIHEHAFGSLEAPLQEWGMENRLGNVQLRHHGYTDQIVKERGKVERNLRLLATAIEEQPGDVSLRMSYGLELVRSGQVDPGLEEYRRAFALMTAQPAAKTPPELRERLLTLMASHFITAQRFQSLIELASTPAAAAAGPTASLHMLFGVAFYVQRKYEEAAKHLKSCIAKRDQPALSPVLPDIHTGAPRHMLALAYTQLGKVAEAEREYHASLKEDPKAVKVRFDFARLLEQTQRLVPALEQLHQIIVQKPGELAAWRLGAEIALRQPEFGEFAADWTAEAVQAFPRDPSLGLARAEVLLKTGRFEESRAYWEKFEDQSKGAHRAALILCQVLTRVTPEPVSGDRERLISQEFCSWFRRLVAGQAESAVRSLVNHLPEFERVLPTAAAALKAVVAEADIRAA